MKITKSAQQEIWSVVGFIRREARECAANANNFREDEKLYNLYHRDASMLRQLADRIEGGEHAISRPRGRYDEPPSTAP